MEGEGKIVFFLLPAIYVLQLLDDGRQAEKIAQQKCLYCAQTTCEIGYSSCISLCVPPTCNTTRNNLKQNTLLTCCSIFASHSGHRISSHSP